MTKAAVRRSSLSVTGARFHRPRRYDGRSLQRLTSHRYLFDAVGREVSGVDHAAVVVQRDIRDLAGYGNDGSERCG
jgi:hypothetical protein